MNEETARKILDPVLMPEVYDDNLCYVDDDDEVQFIWHVGKGTARLGNDLTFTADELEAMAWWMRNKAKT